MGEVGFDMGNAGDVAASRSFKKALEITMILCNGYFGEC